MAPSPRVLRNGVGPAADALITIEGNTPSVLLLSPPTPRVAAHRRPLAPSPTTPEWWLPLYDGIPVDALPHSMLMSPHTPRAVATKMAAPSPSSPEWRLPSYDGAALEAIPCAIRHDLPHISSNIWSRSRADLHMGLPAAEIFETPRAKRPCSQPVPVPLLTPMSLKTDVASDEEFLLQHLAPEEAESLCNLVSELLASSGDVKDIDVAGRPCCFDVEVDASPAASCQQAFRDPLSWFQACTAPPAPCVSL